MLFLLAAAHTLSADGHVRVDIVYRGASPQTKAWIDIAGVLLLLLPFLALLWIVALPYVSASWAVFERSRETSGIPAVFALKTVILLFVVLMALQGLALAARSALTLAGRPLPVRGRP
jgi:TRAP-type mannitol/chloroaromatic compound transport system permease small subunit